MNEYLQKTVTFMCQPLKTYIVHFSYTETIQQYFVVICATVIHVLADDSQKS